MLPARPPRSPPPLPYTTLFRSRKPHAQHQVSVDAHAWIVLSVGEAQDLVRARERLVELGAVTMHPGEGAQRRKQLRGRDRKSTRLNSSHLVNSYAVFCLKKQYL